MTEWATAGLWLAVVASGLYHGLNPGMGWPLAVSAGLMGNGRRNLIAALGSLAGGHFLAMAGILLPFAAMTALVTWQREFRIAAGVIVVAAGAFLLVKPRHLRFLARIRPTQLALWSFAVAMAHGAGLMLVPIYLGLCRAEEPDLGHQAATALIGGNLTTAIIVAAAHSTSMIVAGGAAAFAVYEWLGPKFIAKSWFNLEAAWALSLLLVGSIGLASALNAN
ncbi:MAG TPA: hypothetical protein VFR21_15105 [Bradyrhizobium sp.]|nr:hypothetical protein [Bradyrhizobium sp.]